MGPRFRWFFSFILGSGFALVSASVLAQSPSGPISLTPPSASPGAPVPASPAPGSPGSTAAASPPISAQPSTAAVPAPSVSPAQSAAAPPPTVTQTPAAIKPAVEPTPRTAFGPQHSLTNPGGGLRQSSLGIPRTLLEALAATYSNQPILQAERAKLRSIDENVPAALAGWRPTVQFSAAGGYGAGETRAYS